MEKNWIKKLENYFERIEKLENKKRKIKLELKEYMRKNKINISDVERSFR